MPELKPYQNTIIGHLSAHAESSLSDKELFIFLRGNEHPAEDVITFSEMERRVKSIAVNLLEKITPGEKVILCYPPGIDYILAFYGCLYAGIVAVPVYPPQGKATILRFINVMKDCQAQFILSNGMLKSQFLSRQSDASGFSEDQFLFTDEMIEVDLNAFVWPDIEGSSLAFLQYTSGSTGDPKGVMISHDNIISNLKSLQEATNCSVDDTFVNWLPLFHDLGLVNTMLLPVYLGASSVLMSPLAFVSSPKLWFDAITKYKGTICGGPNFCYELCNKKILPKEFSGLDLSSWRVAFNAAEPIYEKTIETFAQTFSSIGFDKAAFYPSYGMAEATVFLTGRKYDASLAAKYGNEGKNVVACGKTTSLHKLRIVDPQTRRELPEGQVGEIWVSGPSIAMGYLGKPAQTEEIFAAKILAEEETGNWLKTGDLGFTKNQELYVTGRIKEIVIIRGQNYYPTDIERTVQESHSALRVGCGAAFSVVEDDEERLIIVQEVNRTAMRQLDPMEIYSAILASIAQEYQLSVYAIFLLKPTQLEKTTSGKIQRQLCKNNYLNNTIDALDTFIQSDSNARLDYVPPQADDEHLLANILCEELGIAQVGVNDNFFSMGGNSIALTRTLLKANQALQLELPIATIFTNPSISQLLNFIASVKSGEIKLEPRGEFRSIPKINKDNPAPLSFAQQRLWFLWKLEGANASYNESHLFRIKGDLNCRSLINGLHTIVDRHEVLKTRIIEQDGKAIQILDPGFKLDIDLDYVDSDEHVLEIFHRESIYPFALDKDNLLRVKLLKSVDHYFFIVTMHHIVTDGWSLAVITKELNELYEAFTNNRAASLPKLPIQYVDYAFWQRQWLQGDRVKEHLSYWQTKLKDLPILHSIPLDKRRPAEQSFIGKKYHHTINKDVRKEISHFCEEKNVTLFIFLQAVFTLLLHRYTGEADIVIGSPIAGRTHPDIESLVGFFVNTLVLRNELSSNESFNDLLLKVKRTALDAYAHQSIPFEMLVNELQPQRNMGYSPLVQVALVLQNNDEGNLVFPGLEIEKLEVNSDTIFVKYDVELSVIERDGTLSLEWKYSTDLFYPETITRIASYFEVILCSVLENANTDLQNITVLTQQDTKALMADWVRFDVVPQQNSIHGLFEAQAHANPGKIAVVFENQEITYRELNERSNQLAHYLVERGVKPDTLVALFVDRSVEMVLAILAVLKAGGAYVPIDPSNPKTRITHILTSSAVDLIITQDGLLDSLPSNEASIILLDKNSSEIFPKYPSENVKHSLDGFSSGNLAYVIYTSGSTGNPKGVAVTHANVTRLFHSCENIYGFNSQDIWTLFHSYAFDFSVWEIWGALFYGGRLVVVPYWVSRDSEKFIALLNQHQVTVLNQTPSAFEQLLMADKQAAERSLSSLRYIIFGGEALDYKTVSPWFEFYADVSTQLVNMYGITETTVHVTYHFIKPNDHYLLEGSVIGRALPDLQTYVLDDQLHPLPIGAMGELYVAGAGLARGYLNHPVLTAERFIRNPFSHNTNSDTVNDRLYKTGDIVRFLADGNIEYIGRKDHQVKIRGFRIELGEVESALCQHIAVAAGAVLARDTSSENKQLIAYVVPKDGYDENVIRNGLHEHLINLLPPYMLPSAFIMLKELPLTSNGKLDRKALLNYDIPVHSDLPYVAPKTEVEKILSAIWRKLLRVTRIGVQDNFFTLGGDSIIAIQAVSQARKMGLQFSTRDLFKYQSIALLLPHVVITTGKGAISQVAVVGQLPLLPIQKALFSYQLPVINHHNQSLLLVAPEGFTYEHLRLIISALYERHDAFRLRFSSRDCVGAAVYIPFDNSMLDETIANKELHSLSEEQFKTSCSALQESLDIENGPLFKVIFFSQGGFRPRLFLTFHHLIIDGVSWRILLSDIENAWEQLSKSEKIALPEKTSSLQQWGAALHEYANSEQLHREKAYWCKQLSRKIDNIFECQPTTSIDSYEIHTISFKVDKENTSKLLGECNKTYRTRIDELLLAALFHAHCVFHGKPSLRVDIESHGREAQFTGLDVSETVGWFTAIYPLIIHQDEVSDIGSIVKVIKEINRAVPNKGIGYGVLKNILEDVDIHHYERSNSRGILFNYLGQLDNALNNGHAFYQAGELIGLSNNPKNPPIFPLELNCMVIDGQLIINLSSTSEQSEIFKILEFSKSFENSIYGCIQHCLNSQGSYTSSDFPLIRVDQSVINAVIEKQEQKNNARVMDMYPLSSTQEEILFQGLFSPSSKAYFEQMHFIFKESFKEEVWKEAWQYIFSRHEILRTAFDHQNFGQPVQIVFDKVVLPWIKKDLRNSTQEQQRHLIEVDLATQREQGFAFTSAPLVQLHLYQLGDNSYEFVWNFHHILLDGWSMALIIGDVLKVYGALINNTQPHLTLTRPYRDYIEWSQSIDHQQSRSFWLVYLAGASVPLKLKIDSKYQLAKNIKKDDSICIARLEKYFSTAAVNNINKLIREYNVTLNAFFHSALALLLQYYSGSDDIIFGETVSGRPGELDNIESMVGLFIHTIPVRYKLNTNTSISSWLEAICASNSEREQHSYLSLAEINGTTALRDQPLFECLLNIENYPVEELVLQEIGIIEKSDIHHFAENSFPFTLVIIPGRKIKTYVSFDKDRYSENDIVQFLDNFHFIVDQILLTPDLQINEVKALLGQRAMNLERENISAFKKDHKRRIGKRNVVTVD